MSNTQNTQSSQIQTGDDLARQALEETNQGSDVATTLVSLQNVIERNANELDRINEELKIQRQSLKNIFENDENLAAAEHQAQEVTQKVKERKSELKNSLEANQLQSDITDLSTQKKEVQEALNNHLLNYYQMTGSKMFDTSTGEQREFDIRASMKGAKKAA